MTARGTPLPLCTGGFYMRKVLVVVDMQNDFIDGALGTAEAAGIVEAVKEKIRSYPAANVIATMDTHFERLASAFL